MIATTTVTVLFVICEAVNCFEADFFNGPSPDCCFRLAGDAGWILNDPRNITLCPRHSKLATGFDKPEGAATGEAGRRRAERFGRQVPTDDAIVREATEGSCDVDF